MRNKKKYLKNNFWRTILIAMLVVIIVVSFFGLGTYFKTKQKIEDIYIDRYKENLTKIINNTERILLGIESDMLQLLDSSAIRNYKPMRKYGEYVDELIYIQEALDQMKVKNSIINSVYYFDKFEDVIVTNNEGSSSSSKFRDMDWYELIEKNSNGIKSNRLDVRKYADKYLLSLVLCKTTGYYLIVNIDAEKLCDKIRWANILNQEKIIIANSNGQIMSHPSRGEILSQNNSLLQMINQIKDEVGIFKEKELIVSKKSHYNGWYYFMSIPFEVIEFQWGNFRNVIFVYLILFVLLGVFLIWLLLGLLFNPFNKLAKSLEKYSENYNLGDADFFKFIQKILENENTRIVQLESMVNLYRNNLRHKLIMDFIEEMISRNALEKKLKELNWNLRQNYYKVLFINGEKYYAANTESNINIIEDECEKAILELCVGFFIVEYSKNFLILISAENIDDLNSNTNIVIETIQNILNVSLTGVASKSFDDIGLLPEIYNQVQDHLEYLLVFKKCGIHSYNNLKRKGTEHINYPEDIENGILNQIHLKCSEKALMYIDELFLRFKSNDTIDVQTMRRIVARITFVMLKQLPFRKAYEFEILRNTILEKNIDDLRIYLRGICQEVISYNYSIGLKNGEMDSYSERAKKYIDDHYESDISLYDIAEHLKISYPYLSKVFKEGAKLNVSYYLNKKRIDKSKKLLAETDMTIQEIALSIGYNNCQSFNRFFKKYEGITPGNYRILNHNNHNK